MTAKATAIAPANIAFIKYWGALDLAEAIPVNPSISMTLARCLSSCTVEHRPSGRDEVTIASSDGGLQDAPAAFARRILEHLERLRSAAGVRGSFRVATRNSFPSAAGLASSASGFAALTLAVTRALGLELPVRELSVLARRSGSGSAARSVLGGFVQWPAGENADDCYAVELAASDDWDVRDVIAVIDTEPKRVSSLEGHGRAASSPYYEARQNLLPGRIRAVRDAIERRAFGELGPIVEEEAVDLHLIAMSSRPPIFYWKPSTLEVMRAVRAMREDGLDAYFTIDAGANVHVLCLPEAEPEVVRRLEALSGVRDVLRDRVGSGPRISQEHLF